jgi:L-ascorbate oxidase
MGQCDEACSIEDYVPAIPVEAGKTYLFRIINAGGLMSLNLAFANHTMTVVKADGNFVEPIEVTSLEVNLAQRYSVLVTMDQEDDMSYWTAAHPGRGSPALTYLQYNNATSPNENSTMPVHDMDGFTLDSMLVSKDVSGHPDADILMESIKPDRSSVIVTAQSMHPGIGKMKYTSNNVSNTMHAPKPFAAVVYEALMDEAADPWPDTSIPGTVLVPDEAPMTWNFSNTPMAEGLSPIHKDHGMAVFQFVKEDVVEMVFQNTVGGRGSAGSHAWHLHGHEFYIVGQGMGTFEEQDRANFNLVNPVLRDTFSVWDLGWTAIRYRANNPGVWPFHCTMLPHSILGMGFNVITSPDLWTAPPPGLTSCMMTSLDSDDAQTCMLTSEYINLTSSLLELEVARAGAMEDKSGNAEDAASAKKERLNVEDSAAGSISIGLASLTFFLVAMG